jgi:membrane protease YdiL (CAAX protease family)
VPLVAANLHGAIAVLFLFTPGVAARVSGRPLDLREAGLRADPIRLNLVVFGAAIGVTWAPFVVGFFLFYGTLCGRHLVPALGDLAEVFAPMCSRWLGMEGGSLRPPPDVLSLALSQVVVVALPEELFFRGYLYSRLEERWPSRRALVGAPVGWALVASSVLFGLGHVLVDFDPQRLSVVVPGLAFGWLRARTGSIAAGALFHALCNLLSDTLHTSYFR